MNEAFGLHGIRPGDVIEKINGFSESSSNGKNFFNLGPENKWEKMIDKKIGEEIKERFKEEMKNLDYN